MKSFRERLIEILCDAVYGGIHEDLIEELPKRHIDAILIAAEECLVPEKATFEILADNAEVMGWDSCREKVKERIRK